MRAEAVARETPKGRHKNRNKIYTLAAIWVVGFCLRPSLTGIGSVMSLIRETYGISSTVSGMLTTLPLITFALCSSMVNRINNRISTHATILLGFAAIILGVLIRSWLGLSGLFVGTIFLGIGICIGNVLMPAVIKSEFPDHYGIVTSVNSCMLAVSSGIASGINYPNAQKIGWQSALCLWGLVALVGLAAWLPMKRVQVQGTNAAATSFLRSRVAWSVTLFLGISSLLFYSCTSWLATIYAAKGLDGTTAGYFVSGFQLTGIVASFLISILASRRKDQRPVTFTAIGIFAAGIFLILIGTSPAVLFVGGLLAGFGCNGSFALSMLFIGLRAKNAEDTAGLSSMSQTYGYLIAAAGPLGMGWLFGLFGDWNINLVLILILLAALAFVSNTCAKEGTV